ncbi:MAG: diguanylate cyclase [Acetatifactor sp.]|nr:diguanylate cyclase [Acetatifactor sp.]
METTEKVYTCDVLIVDDDEFNLRVAGDILKEKYSICTAQSGDETLDFLEENLPRLILLDLHMPGIDGRETMRRIQGNEKWKKIPIIFLTSDSKPETENECLVLGAMDFITKPFVPMVMLSRISRIMELVELQNDLELKLEEKTEMVEKVSLNSIMVIANAIDAKDTYTSGHSSRVAKCSAAIARQLKWSEKEVQNIYYVALLHDIGKIGVPDAILNKPSRLNNEEFEVIKKHPVIGNDILKDIHMIRSVAEGALYHHERYDGRGYPFGLTGEEIPYCARIIGIADAYDAMTSNRIYRHRLSQENVIKEFEKGKGTQFDPALTDLFLEMLRDGFDVTKERRAVNWDEELASQSSAMLSKALTEYTADIQQKESVDSLTGLSTRNHAEAQIGELLGKAQPGALMLINMDNFKHFNDTFGHIMGDNTLKMFANILKEKTTPKDVVCRLGGDEFVVFLSDMTDRQEVTGKAQDILDTFSDSLEKMNCGNAISVSIGIAVFPGDGKNFEMLYNNADKSLYYVKKSGKNAYAFYSDEKPRDKVHNTGTDLVHIRTMLEGNIKEAEKGVFKVEFEDFQRIYKYISRSVKRNHQQVQTLLFTLFMDENESLRLNFEESMQALELAVASSVRLVDVGTKYSSIQYIVILLDTDIDNGRKVADRIVKKFYQMYGGRGVVVSYDIQTMLSQSDGE